MYFDDFKVTHTKTNVIQYNEYYPFGLQTANSWTRENASNNYLYNGGSELNANSGWYETFFRSYDAALGRFLQVDPLAHMSGGHALQSTSEPSKLLKLDAIIRGWVNYFKIATAKSSMQKAGRDDP